MNTAVPSFIKISLLLVICQVFIAVPCSGQPPEPEEAEAGIVALFNRSAIASTITEKKALNDSIVKLLQATLQQPGSFDYPFSGLDKIGRITSADGKVRIFTWNIPDRDANLYFGFIQYMSDHDKLWLIQLNDRSEAITDPLMTNLPGGDWLGCLIYEIVEKKFGGLTYYTLLGYDPENIYVTRKIIDVLWFEPTGQAWLGKPIFHYGKNTQSRIIFEYAARAQMSLRWNDKMNMIVFDHLSPSRPSYTGNFQYYGPDMSFDALKFENGFWEWLQDVDIRNTY
jgi:hypothetical protein